MRRSSNFNDVLNVTFWLWIPLSDDQLEGDIALSWYPILPISPPPLNIAAALQIWYCFMPEHPSPSFQQHIITGALPFDAWTEKTLHSKYLGCLCLYSSLLAVVNSLRSDLSISHGSHPLCWINTLFWSPELFMKIWNIELQSPQIFKDSNSGNHNSQPLPTTLFDIITATSFLR